MPPQARNGEALLIRNQEVQFSFWPVGWRTRRARLQPQLFVADPWALIAESVERNCDKSTKILAHAFLRQSEDYYKAAHSGEVFAAKPVLLYYSFMNLAKAFAINKGRMASPSRPGHGLSEDTTGRKIPGARVTAYPSRSAKPQIFAEFFEALTDRPFGRARKYTLGNLLSQILPGHRLWCYATGRAERFIPLEKIRLLHHPESRLFWVRLYISRADLDRLGVTHRRLMEETGLSRRWHEVDDQSAEGLVCFEQLRARRYGHRPSDDLMGIISGVRKLMWQTVLSSPPYRGYYLFMCPRHSRADLLPQLLSLYAVMFYLGSITRYRPEHFERILDSDYGAQVESILNETPAQFLYLMASNFLNQEVTKPAII